MRMNKTTQYWLIFGLALISSGLFQLNNWASLKEESPSSLRSGITISTSDDASYLAPVENWLTGEGWRSNAVGVSAYVTRSPGYGIVYMVFRSVTSERRALICLVIFQFLLFAIASTLVPRISESLGLSQGISLFLGVVVAVWPIFSNFLMYSLTEGMVPSLVIVFFYLLLRYSDNSKFSLVWSGVIMAFILLIRPAMLVCVLVYPLVYMLNRKEVRLKVILLVATIALLPLGVWIAYTASLTQDCPNLHPIYQTDSNDLYRPVHGEIWGFHKLWGQSGMDFHKGITGLWNAALAGEDGSKAVDDLISGINPEVRELIGNPALEESYLRYFKQLESQIPSFQKGEQLLGESISEVALRESFEDYQWKYIRAYPLNAMIVVPSKVYWSLAAHSNLSLYVFQKSWRGHWWMETLRILSFGLHLSLLLIFPLVVILNRNNRKLIMFGLPILLYLMYLCFIQRGVEERYTLPFLAPIFIIVVSGLNPLYYLLRNKLIQNQ